MEWTTPEFNYYKKSKSWFVVITLVAIALFIWSVLTKNFLFSLLTVVGYFSLIVYSSKKPNQIKISIDSKGIKVDNIGYSFDNLKSFWIFYQPPHLKEISLKSKKATMPYIKIPLGEENPVEIREILMKYIPERKQKESVIDSLFRSLKF